MSWAHLQEEFSVRSETMLSVDVSWHWSTLPHPESGFLIDIDI